MKRYLFMVIGVGLVIMGFVKHLNGEDVEKEDFTISNFEGNNELQMWQIQYAYNSDTKMELSDEYVTDGKFSCKVKHASQTRIPGEMFWPGIVMDISKLKPDWSGYNTLKFDVYNPHDESVDVPKGSKYFHISVRFSDSDGTRVFMERKLSQGSNHVKIPIKEVLEQPNQPWYKEDGSVPGFDYTSIKEICLFLNPEIPGVKDGSQPNGPVLYYDNIKLVKEHSND